MPLPLAVFTMADQFEFPAHVQLPWALVPEPLSKALFAPCPLRFNLKEICQPKLVLQNREQTEQFPLVFFGM